MCDLALTQRFWGSHMQSVIYILKIHSLVILFDRDIPAKKIWYQEKIAGKHLHVSRMLNNELRIIRCGQFIMRKGTYPVLILQDTEFHTLHLHALYKTQHIQRDTCLIDMYWPDDSKNVFHMVHSIYVEIRNLELGQHADSTFTLSLELQAFSLAFILVALLEVCLVK